MSDAGQTELPQLSRLNLLAVCGIGRSGTSILLQAIAHHPSVLYHQGLGEAPFINKFADFLCSFESSGTEARYHRHSYRAKRDSVLASFRQMLAELHVTGAVSPASSKDDEIAFWPAKCFPGKEACAKLREIWPGLKVLYIIRNGLEVVASSARFGGFASLTFEQLCRRWEESFAVFNYLEVAPFAAVIRHDALAENPKRTLRTALERLAMKQSETPAEFLAANVINSSFSGELQRSSECARATKAWSSFARSEKELFFELCDSRMREYDFYRPYEKILGPDRKPKGDDASSPSPGLTPGDIRAAVEMQMPLSDLAYTAHLSPSFGYLYLDTAKVACTSIKYALQTAEFKKSGKTARDFHGPSIHDRSLSPLARIPKSDSELAQVLVHNERLFRFTFVRNPFTRALSCYLSKIERSLEPKRKILATMRACSPEEISDLSPAVSFEEFLEAVASQPVNEMDIHWRPLVSQTLINVIQFDFVGRFEQLREDISELNRLVFEEQPLELPEAFNRTAAPGNLSRYYTPNAIRLVKDIYAADFSCFLYSETLPTD